MCKIFAPLHREAVLPQRLVLSLDLDALLDIRRESQAADATKRVAGDRLEAVEGVLRALPQLTCRVDAVRLPSDVVAGRRAPQGEAAVASARPLPDAAGVVDADSFSRPREGSRARA